MWVIRTYKCGRVIEKSKFWAPAGTRVRGGRVKGNTSAAKRDQNARQAVRMVARILNCNFHHGDLYVTAKFDDGHLAEIGGDYKTLTRLLGNFTKRLKRHLRRQGVELKWLAVPSEKDGETGEEKRLHVHMVITGAGITWRDGAWYVGDAPLDDLWGAFTPSLCGTRGTIRPWRCICCGRPGGACRTPRNTHAAGTWQSLRSPSGWPGRPGPCATPAKPIFWNPATMTRRPGATTSGICWTGRIRSEGGTDRERKRQPVRRVPVLRGERR